MDLGCCQVGFFIYSSLMWFKQQRVQLQVGFSIKDAFMLFLGDSLSWRAI